MKNIKKKKNTGLKQKQINKKNKNKQNQLN